ncbi:hypothetical protein GF354_05360 [Candidatus Peregrinibacteria bacterium]|nr:hypothetical protein [Candidatus Peregrinibacteria bacterium]
MNKELLQSEILKLLNFSSISDPEKAKIRALIEFMPKKNLKSIFKILSKEAKKIKLLNEKKKRIELKYKLMVDKLVNSHISGQQKKP